jgi:hypothetical protein
MHPQELDEIDLRKNGLVFGHKVEAPSTKARRNRQFMPALPEAIFVKLVRLPRRAWAVYVVALLRSRLERTKTVTLSNCFLRRFGLTRHDKTRALPCLERAGLLRVERYTKRNPVVEILT